MFYTEIIVEQENPNDPNVTLVEWLVAEGTLVDAGTPVAVIETTKTVFELVAPTGGYLVHLFNQGDRIPVRTVLGLVTETSDFANLKQKFASAVVEQQKGTERFVISNKARELMEKHGLTEADLPTGKLIRAQDIEAIIEQRRGQRDEPIRQ